eukprot:4825896-Heterocapsa_arctica.AAC.1
MAAAPPCGEARLRGGLPLVAARTGAAGYPTGADPREAELPDPSEATTGWRMAAMVLVVGA